jgi:hypothetical protein
MAATKKLLAQTNKFCTEVSWLELGSLGKTKLWS